MRGIVPLFLGLFGTFTFSWIGLTVIPNIQIGALNPQMDEEGTDTYPAPQSGMADHGRRVYAANGCIYCHSQQVRADYASADIDRKLGTRRSAPRDYLFDRPVLLGKERLGPDLANVGKRGTAEEEKPAAPGANPPAASPAPAQSPPPPNAGPAKPPAGPAPPGPANPPAQASAAPAQSSPPPNAGPQKSPGGPASPAPPNAPAQASPAPAQQAVPNPSPSASPNPDGIPPAYSEAWHHLHLYSPRSISPDNRDSTMPAYRFLYERHQIGGERAAAAIPLKGDDAPPPGWEIVPSYDAKCLVAYLMSLDQSHPLKEVKSAAAPAPPTASPPAGPAGSPPPAPPKK